MRKPQQGPALQVRDLRKTYQDVVAVDGLDLQVYSGECFGLLGPNGAGKTTTIEICEGINTPDHGEVLVLGRRWGENDRELRELLGISLQETQFSEKLTVEETVQLFRAKVVDVASDALTIEVTGNRDKLAAFLEVIEPFGVKELVQSGMVAIGRGSRSITDRALRSA